MSSSDDNDDDNGGDNNYGSNSEKGGDNDDKILVTVMIAMTGITDNNRSGSNIKTKRGRSNEPTRSLLS